MIPFHVLSIRDLGLNVRLGCSIEERSRPQEVLLSVELRFDEAPAGEVSDQLADTVCYGTLSEKLTSYFESGEFNLIEKLAMDAYRITREAAGSGVKVAVKVHKVKPPVANLRGGSHYACGDFLP